MLSNICGFLVKRYPKQDPLQSFLAKKLISPADDFSPAPKVLQVQFLTPARLLWVKNRIHLNRKVTTLWKKLLKCRQKLKMTKWHRDLPVISSLYKNLHYLCQGIYMSPLLGVSWWNAPWPHFRVVSNGTLLLLLTSASFSTRSGTYVIQGLAELKNARC